MEVPLDTKLVYIHKHIASLDEEDILDIYDKVTKFVPIEPKLSNQQNKIIKRTIHTSKSKKEIKDDYSEDIDSDVSEDIDDYNEVNIIDKKNRLILKYVNGLLKNMGKGKITDLTEFKNIDRDDIISTDNVEHLEVMAKELFKVFDKFKCRYYPTTAKSRPLNVLRGIIKDVGIYTLVGVNTDIYELFNNKRVRRSAMLYSIEKNI
jgi:hypothetical protein